MKILNRIIISLVLLALIIMSSVYITTYHPDKIENQKVTCSTDAKPMVSGQPFKILSWNIQYMAGKEYVFYYDVNDFNGPDERPGKKNISKTFNEVARVILEEDADFVLIQEIDNGAKRTDYENQTNRLLSLLNNHYKCHATAYYWQSDFVPHARIMGAVGMQLATLSKYQMTSARRIQLPLMPNDILSRQFNLKRAILEASILVDQKDTLKILNTHFDAFAQGSDTMMKQVAATYKQLKIMEDENIAWLIGGDFNLLPPQAIQRKRLSAEIQSNYNPHSEIAPLFNHFNAIPSQQESNDSSWYTHFPNDPQIKAPDRTIDYIFYGSKLSLARHYIRNRDTLHISDHLPIVATFSEK